MRTTKSIGNTSAPAAIAASGTATMSTASTTAQNARRKAGRQAYNVATPADCQNPFSLHRLCPPSMAANSADTAPMPRPATMSSLTPASCRARRTPA